MKTTSSSLSDIYESHVNTIEPGSNICEEEPPRFCVIDDSDVTYTIVRNPLKDIFHDTHIIKSKLEKASRKDDIEVFLQCFQEIFNNMYEFFIGPLKLIEFLEDDKSTDVVWRYKSSIIYFSFYDNSSIVNYGAIIDTNGLREREVITGHIEPMAEARSIEYQQMIGCQLRRIAQG